MAVQDLKRTHWLLISVVVGGLLAYSQLFDLTSGKRVTPDDHASAGTQKLTPDALLAELQRTPVGNAKQTAELTVYPNIGGSTYLMGRLLMQNVEGIEAYRDVLTIVPGSQGEDGIRARLDEIVRSNPQVKYHLAWWATSPGVAGLWGGGSVLLIGIVWPALISLAVGAGLAPKPRSREERKRDAAYLASFKPGPQDDAKAAKPAVAQTDKKELDQLTQTLERKLESSGIAHPTPPPVAHPADAPIRKLDGGPVEPAKIVEAPKEDVDWGGQFYPVAHPKHKPHDPAEHPERKDA